MIDKKHNKEDLPVKTGQAKIADPELMQSSTGTAGPASSLSRRKFLGRVSVSAAAMATAVGVPSSLANHRIKSGSAARSEALAQASEEDGDKPRKERAFRIRLKANPKGTFLSRLVAVLLGSLRQSLTPCRATRLDPVVGQ